MIDYCAVGRFQVWFILFLLKSNVASVASQSSSCSDAQFLQAGLQNKGEITVDSQSFDFCDGSGSSNKISAPELQAGHWFSYVTPLTESRITKVEVSGEIPPLVEVFEGSCDALSCESISSPFTQGSIKFFENKIGVEYFFYVYFPYALGGTSYVIAVDEIDRPLGDDMGGAISLSTTDLPYVGDFTTYGARSDLNLDACALSGYYGVWIMYETTFPSEEVVLRAVDSLEQFMNVGVQVKGEDGGFRCIVSSPATFATESIEWIAESSKSYFILVASSYPETGASFKFSLKSRGSVVSPSESVSSSETVAVMSTSALTTVAVLFAFRFFCWQLKM